MIEIAYRHHRHLGTAAAVAILVQLYGCQSPMDSSQAPESTDQITLTPVETTDGQLTAEEISVTTVVDARPAALINGRSLHWGEMRPLLTEAAGAEILEEIILDRQLQNELERQNLVISPQDMARERKLLLERLSDDADLSIRLLRQLRSRERLGTARFDGLIWRNAALRRLVRDEVIVEEEAVKQLYEMLYGPRYQARLMVLSTLIDAQRAIERVEAGERFADVAVEISADSSAARGGLLEPISTIDPTFPDSIRRSLQWLTEGEVSSPILVDNGYAVLLLEQIVPRQDVLMSQVRSELEEQTQLNEERLRMDHYARHLLSSAPVTIFNDELNEAWRTRQSRDR
jgi:parvulin-like peptidyl-prolyl isomerase